jgi:hypothetical protein
VGHDQGQTEAPSSQPAQQRPLDSPVFAAVLIAQRGAQEPCQALVGLEAQPEARDVQGVLDVDLAVAVEPLVALRKPRGKDSQHLCGGAWKGGRKAWPYWEGAGPKGQGTIDRPRSRPTWLDMGLWPWPNKPSTWLITPSNSLFGTYLADSPAAIIRGAGAGLRAAAGAGLSGSSSGAPTMTGIAVGQRKRAADPLLCRSGRARHWPGAPAERSGGEAKCLPANAHQTRPRACGSRPALPMAQAGSRMRAQGPGARAAQLARASLIPGRAAPSGSLLACPHAQGVPAHLEGLPEGLAGFRDAARARASRRGGPGCSAPGRGQMAALRCAGPSCEQRRLRWARGVGCEEWAEARKQRGRRLVRFCGSNGAKQGVSKT